MRATILGFLAVLLALASPVTGAGDGVVRAVLFVSPTCPHCKEVHEKVLPPLLEAFEGQFQVGIVSTATPVGRDLYWAAFQRYGVQNRGVPLLIVGDFALVGSDEIPERLPGLISAYLTDGGTSWPDVPGLAPLLAASQPPPAPAPTPARDDPQVTTPVPEPTPPAAAGEAQEETPTAQAAAPMPPPEPLQPSAVQPTPTPPPPTSSQSSPAASRPAPTSAAPAPPASRDADSGSRASPPPSPSGPLPSAASSGTIPSAAPTPVPGHAPAAAERPAAPAPAAPGLITVAAGPEPSGVLDRIRADPRGNGLAIVVLVGMVAVFLRSLVVLRHPPPAGGTWSLDWLTPVLALAGLGVAAYLAHVEVREIEAVCGPVGDCNTVQQSEYARLFGVVPVGLLGVAGFAAIIVAWGVRRFASGRASSWAAIAILAMTGGGILFSIYLTFLEPFVIGATCLWCVSSAVIMTALYVLASAPARRAMEDLRLGRSRGFERQANRARRAVAARRPSPSGEGPDV